jgi:L-ascorbate metabolism protein UlaG (beta-lactamase superfamily)
MSNQNVYLKPSTLVEPLFNQWYAWPYLIPPASAAMFIANAHIKIMQSFVSAPQVHISALKNPSMLGGPFINYDASKVGEIKQLAEKTSSENAHMMKLAEAIKTLDETLMAEANGFSLESFYQKTPEVLRGYVELVYDLQNNPSIRFIEGLLYKSKFYNPASQSVVLSQVESDGRPFVFSTPRLKSDGRLYLDVPFAHEGLDELFKMEFVSQPYGRVREMLNVSEKDDRQFADFFTEEAPRKSDRYDGEGVRIRYFGHACVLIETKDVSVLCDPVISHKSKGGIDRFTYTDLPESLDYVLITHTHQDHVMFESLLHLRHKIKNLIVPKSVGGDRMDPSLKLILRTVGFKKVYDLEEMESLEIPGGVIVGLPFLGEHADLNVRTKMAWFVKLAGRSIIMAADSNNLESKLYEHLHEIFGDVDVLFLGMECEGAPMSWLYGPLLTKPLSRKNDQSRRFDGSTSKKGMEIVDLLNPAQVYVYAMGQEPWCTFLTSIQYTDESKPIVESGRLVEECRARGITSERLYGKHEIHIDPR